MATLSIKPTVMAIVGGWIALTLPVPLAAQPSTDGTAQFMVVSRTDKSVSRTYSRDQLKALVVQDVAHTKRLYAKGVLRQMWSRRDDAGAVQIFEARNLADVRAALAGYPMVTRKIVKVEIYALAPYGGFIGDAGNNDAATSQLQ